MREEQGAPIAPLTTMRVGGPAARLVTVETADELVDAVREVDDAEEPLLVLAGGSNVVVSDEGFPGTVVRVATRGVRLDDKSACGGADVRVEAGEPWDDVVARAVEERWSGIEALSGIPGSTGATPVQNVGAYGQEVSQTVASVRVYDRRDQQVRTFFSLDCRFGYRTSVFKQTSRYVVLQVQLQLRLADLSQPIAYAELARELGIGLGERAPLADTRAAVLRLRAGKGMVLDEPDHDTWSCGSFFTNPLLTEGEYDVLAARCADRLGPDAVPPRFPAGRDRVKTSAAWLIERAGFGKGYALPGPAALSTKHTLALTNRGSASAADLLGLAREVRDGVRERFGVELVNEPVLVGLSL